MQKQLSKKEFEEEYTFWIQSAAKDIAFAFSQLKPHELKKELNYTDYGYA